MKPKATCGNVELDGQTLRWRVFEERAPSRGYTAFKKVMNAGMGKEIEKTRQVDATTRAEVDTSGQLATTRHSTVARTAAGAVLAGPVGAIVGHASKKRETTDTRRVYVSVESATWTELFAFGGDHEHAARRLAQAINEAARRTDRSQSR